MATLPDVIGFATDIVVAAQPSKTWIIDRDAMQVSRMDSGLESVRQAVEIALNVERYKWTIYDANFGSELDGLAGEDEAYIIAELPRMVINTFKQMTVNHFPLDRRKLKRFFS